MFHVTILGSGSSGNCAVVESPTCKLLVDGGLSARQITKRLALANVNAEDLDGVLVTHEHGDHVGGVGILCKQFGLPVFCNSLTGEAMRGGSQERHLAPHKEWKFFQSGGEFAVKDIAVQTFPVPHDAVDPVGFVLHHSTSSIGFLTDLGFATKLVAERVRSVQMLLIETNHDEKLLQNDTRRPWSVKQRIMSRHGHLSNESAAEFLSGLIGNGLERVILGHLSRDCNSPEIALNTVRSRLAKANGETTEVFCAEQATISPRFAIGAGN